MLITYYLVGVELSEILKFGENAKSGNHTQVSIFESE